MSEPTADHPEPTLVPTPTASEPAPDATPAAAPVFAAPQPAEPPVFAPKPAARPAPPAPDPNAVPPSHAGRSALPVLTAVGFIFVLLAVAWVWNTELNLYKQLAALPPPPPPGVEPARVAVLEAKTATLDAQMKSLEQRLTELEHRPAPTPAAAPPPAPSLGADSAAALAAQLAELETRLKTAEQRQSKLAEQTALAQRVQQALSALDAGEPLGDLPGAPPALSRFAHAKPPTEASLRLSFPAAAAAALAASRPSADGKSLGERILMHASSLVTVKEGSKVLIGAPAATVLGQAQERLEAGDLAGTLTALDALDSPAAQAMAGWRVDARALLDARAALAQMARG